ncbi:MAG: universal stress protein [Bacteroidales bacterium]|nr:universal stress protein [Bacteroidales bacterium]
MKTILIPVDFSEGSLNSCKYAFDFLGKEESIVHLFHIYNDQVMIPDSGFIGTGMETDTFFNSDIILALKEQAEREMDSLKQELNSLIKEKKYKIRLKHTLLGGDPRWEITETIEELQPDLVFMATQGSGKKGFLEGRMAEKIMYRSSVPVLAVPADFNTFKISNVLYTTSFNPLDTDVLRLLLKILESHDAPVQVCHFTREKEIENTSLLMKKLENEFEQSRIEGKINFHLIKTENEKEAINDFTEQYLIDLVSFLPGKKHLLGNLFSTHKLRKKDLFSLELPLLAINI